MTAHDDGPGDGRHTQPLRRAARSAREVGARLPARLSWLSDRALSAALGRPVEMRVHANPFDLARGRVREAGVALGGVTVAGLDLDRVTLRLDDVRLRPGLSTLVSARRVVAHVDVTQEALDRWTGSVALPVRLRLTPGRITAGAGLAGVRLGELDMGLSVQSNVLWLRPRRVGVLGFGVNTPSADLLAVPLPLPPLPRGARVGDVELGDRRARISLDLGAFERDITPRAVGELRDRLVALARPLPRAALPRALPPGPREPEASTGPAPRRGRSARQR
ncbi:MAG TPA: LmeA family phospholipid-binding protein [Acidimicrobiales bacterium]|nr:LmeA family phospholipid-binding protein [Acidimicrobiales bacterium]